MYDLIQQLFEPRTNCVEAARIFANLLRVNITRNTLKQHIEEHPDYPSLLSISDVLTSYGIANISAKFDKSQFLQLPAPFIISITGETRPINFFAVVSDIHDNYFRFYNHERSKWETIRGEELYNRSEGIVLLAEVEDNAGEKDYHQKVREEKRKRSFHLALAVCIPVMLLLSVMLHLFQHGISALLPAVFSVLTLAGAIIGLLLVLYELDQYTPVFQKICRANHKINCGAVLNSNGATIAGISWAVLGFSYFTCQLLLLLFGGITNPGSLFFVSWLNAIAAPYILFSIFYQWRVVKQWCVLCLSVQLILLLQLTTAFIAKWHTVLPFTEAVSVPLLTSLILAYLVPFVSVSLLIPAYRAAKRSNNNKLELQRIKHDPQIFQALLVKQKNIVPPPQGFGIMLGNPNATNRIVKVCSPYCAPCSESHKTIEYLLENNADLQVQIIFWVYADVTNVRNVTAMHLMAIAEKGNETITKEALDSWYLRNVDKDYEILSRQYPLNGEIQKQVEKVKVLREWCGEMKVQFTPTFFINGYQLPDIYDVTDLKYFLSV